MLLWFFCWVDFLPLGFICSCYCEKAVPLAGFAFFLSNVIYFCTISVSPDKYWIQSIIVYSQLLHVRDRWPSWMLAQAMFCQFLCCRAIEPRIVVSNFADYTFRLVNWINELAICLYFMYCLCRYNLLCNYSCIAWTRPSTWSIQAIRLVYI